MELGLKNKIAFVAASSQGLGKAVAIELAKEGAKLIINGRNKENLEITKLEIEKISGGEVLALAGDLSNDNEREQIIKNLYRFMIM
jgi:3-oxoacyl-[acyl-carrier protein] reductase